METAPESPDEDGDYIMHRENGLNSYGSLSTWLSANGYNKMQDLSSGITDRAGLTYSVKRLYKTGNVCTLTIKAKNETGSEIAANTALFSLPSGSYDSSNRAIGHVLVGATVNFARIESKVSLGIAIPNNTDIYIAVSYAVA